MVGRAVLDVLEADPTFILRHGFTYSGHPTACVAGIANLEILEREQLFDRAAVIAERLGGGLQALAADGAITEARGVGRDLGRGAPRRHGGPAPCATPCSPPA